MVAKVATELGREMYKPRPQVTNNDRVRSEVGETESGNAGINPNSNIYYFNTNNDQFTPNPVTTAATAPTVTVTTSPVSMTTQKWEQHYKLWVPAPQVGQISTMGIGQIATQPAAVTGQPITSSQQTWPSLPVTLGTTSITATSIPTLCARAATKDDDPLVQTDVLPVLLSKQEEGVADEVVQMTSDFHFRPYSRGTY